MIRDAAYQSMARTVRIEAHHNIALTLSTSPESSENSQSLAHHFAGAEDYSNAVKHGTDAARHALSQALNEDAEALATRALAWSKELMDSQRLTTELVLNEILTHIKILSAGWADTSVKEHADKSLSLIRQLEEKQEIHSSIWSLALYHHVAGDRRITAQLAAKLIELTRNKEESALHCNALGLRGQCAFIDGEFRNAERYFRLSLAMYDAQEQSKYLTLSSVDTKVWSLSQLANMQWLCGLHHQAVSTSAEALNWAKRLGHIPSFGIALLYRAMLCQFAANREMTSKVSQSLLSLSEQYGLPAYQGYATVLDAWSRGDQAQLQGMLTGLRTMGCQLGLSQYDALIADICLQRGEYQEAIHCLNQCIIFARRTGERYYVAELHNKLAEALMKVDGSNELSVQKHKRLAQEFLDQGLSTTSRQSESLLSAPNMELPDRLLNIAGSTTDPLSDHLGILPYTQ